MPLRKLFSPKTNLVKTLQETDSFVWHTSIHLISFQSDVPDAPEVSIGVVNRFGATVTWEPPSFDGGSEISAYVIELRDRTSVKWEAALVCSANDRSATLNDVVEHKEYIFRVRAENKAGIGRPSAATNPVKIMDPIGDLKFSS